MSVFLASCCDGKAGSARYESKVASSNCGGGHE